MKRKVRILSLVFVLLISQFANALVPVAAEGRPSGNLRDIFKEIYNENGYKDEEGNTGGYTDLNFVTDIVMTKVVDGKLEPIIGDELELGATYNFGFEFKMPSQLEGDTHQTWRVQEGDHFTIKLPALADSDIDLTFGRKGNPKDLILEGTDEKGKEVEYAKVTFDGNEMFIKMLPGVKDMDLKGGFINLQGMFGLGDGTGVGDIEIRNPFDEETKYTLKNPSTIDGLQVQKTFMEYNLEGRDGTMKWEVVVNRNYKHYNSLTLTDTPPVGHTFEGNPKVYSAEYNSAGKLVPDSKQEVLAGPDTYTINESTKVITFYNVKTPYHVEYVTTFDYEDNRPDPNIEKVTMENKVALTDGVNTATSSAKHDVKYEKRLIKTAGVYDAVNRKVKWTVDYGTPPNILPKTTLEDTLPKEMILLKDTLTITHHPKAPSTEGEVKYILDKDYKLKYNEGDATFEIELLKDTEGKLKITYETQIREDFEITEDLKFTNEIKEKDGKATSGGIDFGIINQEKIFKSNKMNHTDKTISWTLTINEDKRNMINPKISDVLKAGLYFTSENDVIVKRDGVIVESSKYIVEFTSDKKKMDITFVDKAYDLSGSSLIITYKTTFDVRDLLELPKENQIFCNSVKVDFESKDKLNESASRSSCGEPKKEQLENGQKLGEYNYESKVIKWNVFSNFNENVLKDAELIDTLPEGLVFPAGIKFTYYLYSTSSDGKVQASGDRIALTEEEVKKYISGEPEFNAGRTEVKFKFVDDAKSKDGLKNAQIEIEFETPVGAIIKPNYLNNVKFTNGGIDYEFEKDLGITNGGRLGSKYADQSIPDDLIKWVVEINFSQSTVENYTIDDLMSDNQIMIWNEDSKPILYDAVVEYDEAGKKGQVTKGEKTTLINPKDYTIEKHPGIMEDGVLVPQNGFQFKFNQTIDKPYVLEYYTLPNFEEGSSTTIENTIRVSGDGVSYESVGEQQKQEIEFDTSSGGAFASLTKVAFVKYDQFDKVLEGVEFKLTSPHTDQFERNAKSDANGIVTFDKLTKGEYLLTELIDGQEPEIKNGLVGHIGLTKGESTRILTSIKDLRDNTIYNWNHNITINKIDGLDKTPIANTEFTLYIQDGNGDYVFDKVGVTDINGSLRFDRLLKTGKYKLVESKAAPGYILDTKIEKYFEIKDEDVDWIKSPSNEQGGADNFDPRVCPTGVDPKTASKDDCSLSNFDFEFKNYRGDVNFRKTDVNKVGLAGAQFEIIHEDPVANPGPYLATSDVDGNVVFNNIPVGNYTLKEINVLDGYLENTQEIQFTVEGQASDTVEGEANGKPKPMGLPDFINYKGSAQFMKVDEKGTGLAGAVFEATHENGETFTATSAEDGMVTFTDLLAGEYTVKEITPAPGYLLNKKTFTFEVSQTTKGKALPVSNIDDFANYKASVAFKKVDSEGNPLAGVLFHLTNDEEVYTAISDKDGYVFFSDVSSGEYVLTEEISVDGYFVNSIKRDVIVDGEYDGEAVVIELEDFINYKGSLEFNKTDVQGNGLEGAEFTLTHNEITGKEYKATSNELGLVVFENLEAGTYSLVETKAPQGYLLSKDVVTVDLGVAAEDEPKRLKIDPIVNFKNSEEIKKVDKNKNILNGAEFKLLKDGVRTDIELILVDGEILLTDLELGEYQLIETKAPEGYELDPTPIKFTIHDGSTRAIEAIEIEVVNHLLTEDLVVEEVPPIPVIPAEPVVPGDPVVPVAPIPTPDPLPGTGVATKLPFLGISLVSLGSYLVFKRLKKEEESN